VRDHATIAATFWTRGTGKLLRGHPEAQVVALYVMSCPASSMVGIFHVALPTLCHETGLTIEGARKGLRRCFDVGFCEYDEGEELVWVPNLARFQVGDTLKVADRRRLGIIRGLKPFTRHSFYPKFMALYAERYGLNESDLPPAGAQESAPETKPLTSPFEGASESLRRDYDPDPDPLPVPAPVSVQGVQGGPEPAPPVEPKPSAAERAPVLPFAAKPPKPAANETIPCIGLPFNDDAKAIASEHELENADLSWARYVSHYGTPDRQDPSRPLVRLLRCDWYGGWWRKWAAGDAEKQRRARKQEADRRPPKQPTPAGGYVPR
jgi:hypothetical protein